MSKGHQTSRQESWGRESQYSGRKPQQGPQLPTGPILLPPYSPSPELAIWPTGLTAWGWSRKPRARPTFSGRFPHSCSFWLCGRGMAVPTPPGMTTALHLPPRHRARSRSGLRSGSKAQAPRVQVQPVEVGEAAGPSGVPSRSPVPAPRPPPVTCASPGLPRGTLPPALSTGDWRLWAASAAP